LTLANSNRGPGTGSPQNLLDPIHGLAGQIRSGARWQDMMAQLAVRAARMPIRAGLIGGEYARYVARNLAPTLEALGRGNGPAPASPTLRRPVAVPPATAAPAQPASPPAMLRPAAPLATIAPVRPEAASAAASEKAQLAALRSILIEAEGYRPDVYSDSLKIPTVGIGHKVRPADQLRLGDKIGDEQIEKYFREDTAPALEAARAQAARAGITEPTFIAPLASVNFQLGSGWNNEHKRTWGLIQDGDYAGAAEEVARSKWYRQTPKRVTAFQAALRRLPPKPGAK